ncbi:uncharacterized protein LOC141918776 [Strix aluco]|uniref:uncharacterized protein LOC141918776 n=2 Tax=Strix TaxID=36304 RepID=UPI003DA282C7
MAPRRSRVSLLGVPCVGPLPCRRKAGHLPGAYRRTLTRQGAREVRAQEPVRRPALPGVVRDAAGRAATESAAARGGGAGPRAAAVGALRSPWQRGSGRAGPGRAGPGGGDAAERDEGPARPGPARPGLAWPGLLTPPALKVVVELQVQAVFERATDSAAVTEMVGRNITKNRVLHKNNHYGASTSVQKEELSSSFDNCEASNTSVKMIKAPLEQATSEHDSSSLGTDGPEGCLHYPPSQRDSAFHRAASSATSQHLKSPNPVGSPSAFQNTYLILKEISYLSDFVL